MTYKRRKTTELYIYLVKDPKTGLLLRRRLLESAIDSVDTTTPVISIYIHNLESHRTTPAAETLRVRHR